MKNVFKKMLPHHPKYWEITPLLGLRRVMRYEGREIVLTNSILGLETVYLDGEVVSEKRNIFSTKSIHKIVIDDTPIQLRIWTHGITPSAELYKGLNKLETSVESKDYAFKSWGMFYAICFSVGLMVGLATAFLFFWYFDGAA